jgi:hypothetical protein
MMLGWGKEGIHIEFLWGNHVENFHMKEMGG